MLDMGEGGTAVFVHQTSPWAEILAAGGELDLAVVPQFSSALEKLFDGSLPVVLDLSECSYLDSTILRVLVGACNAWPGRFGIVIPTGARVRRVFQVAGLEGALLIGASREDLQQHFLTKSS
jgi:anti-anti-sigma factor